MINFNKEKENILWNNILLVGLMYPSKNNKVLHLLYKNVLNKFYKHLFKIKTNLLNYVK